MVNRLPNGWDEGAHASWCADKRQHAVNVVLSSLNQQGSEKALPLVLQLAYYIFLMGDPLGAASCLQQMLPKHGDKPELLLNLSVCLSRGGAYSAALPHLEQLLRLQPESLVGLDCLCKCLYEVGHLSEAAAAGTRALTLKDSLRSILDAGWRVPDCTPESFACQPGKSNVIAFSLWGRHPRYLRGALDNVLQANEIYPHWVVRMYVDESTPAPLCETLSNLGADIRLQVSGQTTLQRLGWRFQVANDPSVGRFLVRDVDSVVNSREQLVVDAWIQSERWFHVMRDWWTHTDLVLAGMWGGVANILPPLTTLMNVYTPSHLETPNIDQWFLRDMVWPYIRNSCLVHDRIFSPPDASPWPEPPPQGNTHVGQDIYAVDKQAQAQRLNGWIRRLKCLQESR